MKRTWYMRLIFSYLPLFFVIISLLVTIFVFSMTEITRNAAERINQDSAQHVMQMVENALENTEFQFIRMLNSDSTSSKELQGFFLAPDDDLLNSTVVPSNRLHDLAVENPLINSVYLVRWSDGSVLIHNTSTNLDNFEDRAFVESFRHAADYGSWSEQRFYRTFNSQNPTNVVSLVRPYPIMYGSRGLIVINISVKAILDFVQEIGGSNFLEIRLIDQNDRVFQGAATDYVLADIGHPTEKTVSEYTGWKISTVMQGNNYLQYASRLMYVLWISGIAAVIGAALYIIFISRRNYKPLRKLTEQIESYSLKRAEQLFNRADKDEFSYIETAIDQIIEETDDYMQQKEEHLKHKKKLGLQALLEGQFESIKKEIPDLEQLFEWPLRDKGHVIVVAEIDRYIEFQRNYSRRDQSLLKFVIVNVFQEIMHQHDLQFEGEWVLANLWVAILPEPQTGNKSVQQAIEQVLTWVYEKLEFTITFALGESVNQIEEVHAAYERSLEILQYKSTLGSNRLIGYWDIPNQDELNPVKDMIQLQHIANLYRRQDPEWNEAYHGFIRRMQEKSLNKDETWYLLNYLVYQVTADIYSLSNDYRKAWDQYILPAIHTVMSEADTLQDVHMPLFDLLQQAEREFSALRQDRTYSATMHQVKIYLDEQYADPQLSLNFLSESFQLNPKYLSHLFKEETGEKFIDYLANLRISRAKELLLTTNHSVQHISEHVGYNHAFSFIRVFKKIVGLTPGDFRRSFQEE